MAFQFNPNDIRAIIGIGNYEAGYETTYHNVGFQFVETLAGETATWRSAPNPLFTYAKRGTLVIAKSKTWMNESGIAVKALLAYFSIPPSQLLVVHDDADLKLGTYKFVFERGNAGHKGVASIFASLGTRSFWRLRLGIRDTEERRKRIKAEQFVLSPISHAHQKTLEELFLSITKTYFPPRETTLTP